MIWSVLVQSFVPVKLGIDCEIWYRVVRSINHDLHQYTDLLCLSHMLQLLHQLFQKRRWEEGWGGRKRKREREMGRKGKVSGSEMGG